MLANRILVILVAALLGAGAAYAAQTVNANAVVNNKVPVLGTVTSFPDPITPVAGGTQTLTASLGLTDANGHQDLVVSAALSGPGGLARTLAVALTPGSSPDAATAVATVPMNYWDAPGAYTITFSVNDQKGVADAASPQLRTTGFNFDSLLALHLDSTTPSLAFSTLDPGAVAEDDLKIWNYGNVAMDVTLDVGSFTSGSNSIGESALSWSTSPTPNALGPNAGDGVADTNTPVGPTSQTGPAPWSMLYFDLSVPNVMPGTYTGTLTLAATTA